MKKNDKKTSIAWTVTKKISITLICMCITLSLAIQNAFYRELSVAEGQYMSEVVARISAEMNAELNHFIDGAVALAKSKTLQEYLLNVESKQSSFVVTTPEPIPEPEPTPELAPQLDVVPETESVPEGEFSLESDTMLDETNDLAEESEEEDALPPVEDTLIQELETLSVQSQLPFSQVKGYEDVISELNAMAKQLGSSVMAVAVCSVDRDNFFNNTGGEGDDSFTMTTRPFYPTYTTGRTYITDPYVEVLTGEMIITVGEPVTDESGRIIGLLLVQLSMKNLSNIVTAFTFGESGSSMLLDRNNNIIAYSIPSVVGMNLSQLDYSGESVEQELANPTGQIDEYVFSGVKRTGAMIKISELSGWKMLLAMDSSEFKSNLSGVVFRFNLGLTLAVLICSAFCARNIFRCLAPLKQIEDYMEELAEGHLSATLEYEGTDEIGRLAKNMNRMSQSLSNYINMIDRALIGLGNGDFTKPDGIDFKGDFHAIDKGFESFALNLSESFREIKMAMSQINQGSIQVSSGAQQLANGSSEQSLSVEGLHRLIGSINENIVVTAQNSSSVTTDAKNISDNLVISNEKMQQLVVSVQDIRSMSDEVKRIIKTIEDVAFQTNILSLNASVEAARAGTSGRGFAVVADQVRVLSATTAEAADQTTKIINDIANAIQDGTTLAQVTSKELQAVVDDVDVFVENISSISLSTQDQANAIAEINRGIDNISQVVMQNGAISEESAASSEELSSQSNEMLNLVERYKLKDKSDR